MVHREVYYGKPINSGTMMSNPCPSTFLDKNELLLLSLISQITRKNIHLAVFRKMDVTGNKTLNSKYYVRSRSVNTEILNYFHPMPGTENMVIVPGWRQLERTNIP